MKRIFRIKVKLLGIEPPVWRSLEVDSGYLFYELHHVLQIAFGWENRHLFMFRKGSRQIGIPDQEFDDPKTEASNEVHLFEILDKPGAEMFYEYDFGDGWQHIITVESEISKPQYSYPVCLQGARRTPPEDCGGVPGYDGILKILASKKHPEYKETKRWLGKGFFDPEFFDVDAVNKRLSTLDRYIKRFDDGGGFYV